jgi:2-C-methyl-D-erythritol 4-phosphate cytidylyltransferase
MHTLQAFLECRELDQIYMGVHPEWMEHMADLVGTYVEKEEQERVHLVPGGAERNETIMNVIDQIEADFGTEDVHYIITQDGVRPFVSQRLIKEHVEAVAAFDAVDTAIPAVDTIIVSMDGETISEIPERKYLYQSQTPQSFRMDLLKKLYMELTEDEKKILTDACKICTVRGVPVRMVMGDVTNMKITTAADFEIAKIMAKQQ